MLISQLLNNAETGFCYLEKRVNNESFQADVSESYRRDGAASTFDLPFVMLDAEEVFYCENSSHPKIKQYLQEEGKIKFFIHPEMIEYYKRDKIYDLVKIAGHLPVSVTSSTRTVFTRELFPNFMIKTNLERKLGDSIKRLRRSHIIHSNQISQELEHAQLHGRFAYLPETMGVVFSRADQEIGMIVREFCARPTGNNGCMLVPLFSLFSQDASNPYDELLLTQILERIPSRGGTILDVCIEAIVKPYLDIWAQFVLKLGLNLEMHAQNTLIELNHNGVPARIVYRDLQDTFVDCETRTSIGLGTTFTKNIMGQEERAYETEQGVITDSAQRKQISYSLTYDFRIGKALDHICRAMVSHHNCDAKAFCATVKQIWKNNFSGTEIFPKMAFGLAPSQKELEHGLKFIETEPKYR